VVEIRPKTVVTMKLEGKCPTGARTEVLVRDLSITVDEPAERGGTNLGPSPTETMLASLVACTNRITHKVADAKGVKIEDMAIALEASFDRRGVEMKEEVDVPFPEIRLRIDVTTDADEAAMAEVKAGLHRFCPISKVIRQAGTNIIETWNVRRP